MLGVYGPLLSIDAMLANDSRRYGIGRKEDERPDLVSTTDAIIKHKSTWFDKCRKIFGAKWFDRAWCAH